MSAISTQMRGAMRIKYGNRSWTEGVNLLSSVTTYSTAIVALTALVNKRLLILPDNAFITRASVSFKGRPREAKLVRLSYPLAGLAATATTGYTVVGDSPNDVNTSLHVRFETADGNWVNHYIRCLPDDVVTGEAITGGTIAVVTSDPSTPYATWYDRMASYLLLLKTSTAYGRVLTKGDDTTPPSIDNKAWDGYIPIGLTDKKTGASFKTPRGRRPVGA